MTSLEDTSAPPALFAVSLCFRFADVLSCAFCCFQGDSLFVGGCGRFFEGTGSDMFQTFARYQSCPLDTVIYSGQYSTYNSFRVRLCHRVSTVDWSLPHATFPIGHEYTVSNLEFALKMLPDSKAIANKLAWARDQRRQDLPTVPSTLREELQYNLFLLAATAEDLAKLRLMKDNA